MLLVILRTTNNKIFAKNTLFPKLRRGRDAIITDPRVSGKTTTDN